VKQEPFGLALTPDGKTLLVTTVADHQLTAYSTKTGKERWSIDLAPEPRGIAISPDGKEATISFLTSSAVGRVKLADDGTKLGIRYISLNRERSSAKAGGFIAAPSFRRHRSFGTAPDGKRFARNAFATTYIGNGLNVVAFQGSTPRANTESARETRGTYGGGGGRFAPVVHRLALVAGDEHRGARQVARAHIDIHQPRAMAYDETTDTLYIAGAGSDSVMAVESVSQPTIQMAWRQVIPKKDGMRCAPTGIDVAADGDIVVFCSLTRSIARIERTKKHTSVVVNGPELAKSKLSKLEMAGKELFTRGNNTQTSVLGAMACSSCHPEGRTDGLSWRIEGKSLQTPILAGRVMGTHPFKWDGQDKNLQSSLINTVRRLGGSGISVKQAKQLTAFLDTLKPPRAPTIEDHKAVTRGKKLFGSKTLGCASCHSGAKLTDGASYELASDIEKVDTPSLIGIAHSAPYYHDGSATTLRSLLLENGTIHGMGNVKNMTNPQVDDLIAYLETL